MDRHKPDAAWTWAQNELGDAKPKVLSSAESNFEQIAALRPDLILGIYSGIVAKAYARLSKIAPTVTQPHTFVDFEVPWQEQTKIIGRALGRERRASALRHPFGFHTDKQIDKLAGDQFFTPISGGRLRLLDQDVLIMIGPPSDQR